jgi:putative ABC transport system substrate-binding protein
MSAPPAEAQSERVFRLGLLVPATVAESIDAFIDQLRQLGYEEERNLVLVRNVVETAERNAALAAELVALKPDVLLGAGSQQVEALKRATTSIPIVFAWVSDPVGLRIVETLARPGGNVTGIANFVRELSAKRLEIISETIPGAARIAFLFDPRNAAGITGLKETDAAAATRRIVLVPAPARSRGAEIGGAFGGEKETGGGSGIGLRFMEGVYAPQYQHDQLLARSATGARDPVRHRIVESKVPR